MFLFSSFSPQFILLRLDAYVDVLPVVPSFLLLLLLPAAAAAAAAAAVVVVATAVVVVVVAKLSTGM